MSGFLPRGLYPIAVVREAIGLAKLGAYLASGDLLAFAQIDGELKGLASDGWMQEGSDSIVEAGAFELDGKQFPIFVTSRNPKLFAMMIEARPIREAPHVNRPIEIGDQTLAPARRRGVRASVGPAVRAAMQLVAPSDLAGMTEEAMSAQFGASRDTCRKARNEVLQSIDNSRPLPTIDK